MRILNERTVLWQMALDGGELREQLRIDFFRYLEREVRGDDGVLPNERSIWVRFRAELAGYGYPGHAGLRLSGGSIRHEYLSASVLPAPGREIKGNLARPTGMLRDVLEQASLAYARQVMLTVSRESPEDVVEASRRFRFTRQAGLEEIED